MLTQERLKQVLHYDCETGVLVWKISAGKSRKGNAAGSSTNRDGYVHIGIDRKIYSGHRLAWLWVHGSFPVGQIDHVNGVRTDNRLVNLREVSCRENGHNRKEHRSGQPLGTTFHKRDKCWEAQVWIDGSCRKLGRFASAEAAHVAYLKATVSKESRQ